MLHRTHYRTLSETAFFYSPPNGDGRMWWRITVFHHESVEIANLDGLNNVLTTPDGTPNVGALGRAPARVPRRHNHP